MDGQRYQRPVWSQKSISKDCTNDFLYIGILLVACQSGYLETHRKEMIKIKTMD